MSVFIYSILLFYASVKFVHLVTRHNPDISSHTQSFFFDSSKSVDLVASDVRVAFGIEGFLDSETKDDARFVKYVVRTFGKKDGVFYEHLLDYHICSAEELDRFGEPAADSTVIKYYRSVDSKKRLFCLDWDDLDDG